MQNRYNENRIDTIEKYIYKIHVRNLTSNQRMQNKTMRFLFINQVGGKIQIDEILYQ